MGNLTLLPVSFVDMGGPGQQILAGEAKNDPGVASSGPYPPVTEHIFANKGLQGVNTARRGNTTYAKSGLLPYEFGIGHT